MVYGHSSPVEIDVAVKDGVHTLLEEETGASGGDVAEFYRIGEPYESTTGIKPRQVLVTPFIDDEPPKKPKPSA